MHQIRSGSEQLDGWLLLAALYGTGPASESTTQKLQDILKALDLCKLVKQDRSGMVPLMIAISNRALHVGNDTRAVVLSSLLSLAGWLGSHDGTDAEAESVANFAISLSYPAPGRSTTVEDFQQHFADIALAFPKVAGASRHAINRFCCDLPMEKGVRYWPLLLALRAIDPN